MAHFISRQEQRRLDDEVRRLPFPAGVKMVHVSDLAPKVVAGDNDGPEVA